MIQQQSNSAAAVTATAPLKRTWKTRLRRLTVRLVIWYAVWLCIAVALQRYIVFPRYYAQVMEDAGEGVAGLQKTWLETEQGKVEMWFVPGEGVTPSSPGPAVLYAHGN